jgi:hypothetical protein
MNKKFEDFIYNDKQKVMRFNDFENIEYRKGSIEYGQLFHDLMLYLRLKREEDKDADEIIVDKKELKNIDFDKLKSLSKDIKQMRSLGMSFDIEIKGDKIKFYNLKNVNKESRPWENNNIE